MKSDLILYPADKEPMRLIQINSEQCLTHLLPYLTACRKSGSTHEMIAEIEFESRRPLWFSSKDGVVRVHRSGKKWMRIFPFCMRQEISEDVSDESLSNLIRSAYNSGAEQIDDGNSVKPPGDERTP